VIDYIEEQRLMDNCTKTGAYLRARLEELKEKHELIGDVRGMGLLQAIELVEDRQTKSPATAQTAMAMEAARENRLLIGKGGMYGNVLRISPPMNVGRTDVDQFLGLLDKSLSACAATVAGSAR
jgi:4-aminobutyrate aminotransferase-like enzyme